MVVGKYELDPSVEPFRTRDVYGINVVVAIDSWILELFAPARLDTSLAEDGHGMSLNVHRIVALDQEAHASEGLCVEGETYFTGFGRGLEQRGNGNSGSVEFLAKELMLQHKDAWVGCGVLPYFDA